MASTAFGANAVVQSYGLAGFIGSETVTPVFTGSARFAEDGALETPCRFGIRGDAAGDDVVRRVDVHHLVAVPFRDLKGLNNGGMCTVEKTTHLVRRATPDQIEIQQRHSFSFRDTSA